MSKTIHWIAFVLILFTLGYVGYKSAQQNSVMPEEEKQYEMLDVTRANPTQLYEAADTAWEKKDMVEAGFLLSAARIRSEFDRKRYGKIDETLDGINYKWESLEEYIGQVISRESMRNYETWNSVVKKVEEWNVIPVDESQYTAEYGALTLTKDKWEAEAQAVKKSFLDSYAYKFLNFLKDPKNVEVWNYVNDYTLGYIEATPENEKVFVGKLKALSAALKENSLHAH